jgi:hypothetical protein
MTFRPLAEIMMLSVTVACAVPTPQDRAIDYLALCYAARGQNAELVEALLERGAPVDAPDVDSAGLLSAQAVNFDSPLQAAARNGDVEIVRLVLSHHPWVDHRCCDSPPPLGFAAAAGHLEIVRLLIEAGADPSIVASYASDLQGTALDAARHNGHTTVVELLEVAGQASFNPCPNEEYENRLAALRVWVPAVAAETPPEAALAGFFNALPSDFSCFNRIFGYDDAPAPLYFEPELSSLFPKIAAVVPRPTYARKLIGLSVNARWEADQTGALQHAARSVLDVDTRLFVGLLGELGADAEQSVWEFLFGGPHPSNVPLLPAVQLQVCKASSRSCELSNKVYRRGVGEEEHHG